MNKPPRMRSSEPRRPWAAPPVILLICAVLLFAVAIQPLHGLVAAMRWTVFLTFIWSAYIAWFYGRKPAVVLHLAIAVLFNPLVPVRLEREVWIFIDIAICVLALTLAWLHRKKNPTETDRENRRDLIAFVCGLSSMTAGTGSGMYLSRYLGIASILEPVVAVGVGAACFYFATYLVSKFELK